MKKLVLIISIIGLLISSVKVVKEENSNLLYTWFTLKKSPTNPIKNVFVHVFNSYADTISRMVQMDYVANRNPNSKHFPF